MTHGCQLAEAQVARRKIHCALGELPMGQPVSRTLARGCTLSRYITNMIDNPRYSK